MPFEGQGCDCRFLGIHFWSLLDCNKNLENILKLGGWIELKSNSKKLKIKENQRILNKFSLYGENFSGRISLTWLDQNTKIWIKIINFISQLPQNCWVTSFGCAFHISQFEIQTIRIGIGISYLKHWFSLKSFSSQESTQSIRLIKPLRDLLFLNHLKHGILSRSISNRLDL